MTAPESEAQPRHQSPAEALLVAIEAKTSSPLHLRILKAARATDPTGAMESEFSRVMEEILHET